MKQTSSAQPAQQNISEILNRLEPFVHGLGKAILREAKEAAQPAQQEKQMAAPWHELKVDTVVVNRNTQERKDAAIKAALEALKACSEDLADARLEFGHSYKSEAAADAAIKLLREVQG